MRGEVRLLSLFVALASHVVAGGPESWDRTEGEERGLATVVRAQRRMVLTRLSEVEEGEGGGTGAAQAAEDKAVQAAKKRAAASVRRELSPTLSKKVKAAKIAAASKKAGEEARAAHQETRAAQQQQASSADEDRTSALGYLNGRLKRKRGQVISESQVEDTLRVYYNLIAKDGLTRKQAVPKAASLLLRSPTSVRENVAQFEAAGGNIISKCEAGKGGTDRSSLLPDTQNQIELWIKEKHESGTPVYCTDIHQWLTTAPPSKDVGGEGEGHAEGSGEGQSGEKEYDEGRCAIEVSIRTVRNWLAKMGYKVQEGRTGYTLTDDRKARIREYLIDLSKAVAKVNDDTQRYKLVFMDESYIHINHRDNTSWFKGEDNKTQFATGKGQRIIIVHAIDENGPLVTRDGDGFPIEEGWFKGVRAKEAARAAAAKARKGRVDRGARGGRGRGGGRVGGRTSGRGGSSGGPDKERGDAWYTPQRTAPTPAAGRSSASATPAATEKRGAGGQSATRQRTRTEKGESYAADLLASDEAAKRKVSGEGGGAAASSKRPAVGGGARPGGGAGGGTGSSGSHGGRSGAQGAKRKVSGEGGRVAASSKRPAVGGGARPSGEAGGGIGSSGSHGGSSDVQGAKRKQSGGSGKGKGKQRAEVSPARGETSSATVTMGGIGSKSGGGSGGGKGSDSRMVIEKELTAELTFPAGAKDKGSDYHDYMDADTFMQWIEKRLVPVFREKYPGYKMILILDNAPYHHGMPADWKSPLLATKEANLATLRKLVDRKVELDREAGSEVDGIMADREGGDKKFFALPGDGQGFCRAPNGPTGEDVQQATYRLLKQKAPDMLETRAESYFREHEIGELLYTAPYCPNTQPIELFWGHGKNDVARIFVPKRSLLDVWEMLRGAWYGRSKRGTAAVDCFKLVRNSFKYAQKLLAQDEVLEGLITVAEKQGDKTIMNLDPSTIPSYYRVSKNGRLGRALDTAVDDDGLLDEGPSRLAEITVEESMGQSEAGSGGGASSA